MKLHFALFDRAQKIDQVLRVETNLHVSAVVFDRNGLFALAGFRDATSELLTSSFQICRPNSSRTFVGKLRHALDGRLQLVSLQHQSVWDVLSAAHAHNRGKLPVSFRLSSRRLSIRKNR